ncbi:Pre-mRNA-splicing factor SPF27 [Cladochytrium replicatum]|nr:Pre-mRNA-splicing factor SPF27 [Cladochytrium replicatum]
MIDSLPYIDRDYDQADASRKQLINSLIDKERRALLKNSTSSLHSSLPTEVSLFSDNSLLLDELSRIDSGHPIPPLSTARYRLDPPSSDLASDPTAWLAALNNARAQLESQSNRVINLELLLRFGPDAWKLNAYTLEKFAKILEKEGGEAKKNVVEMNRKRKGEQTEGGLRLQRLEERWTELVSNVVRADAATMVLRAEIAALRKELKDEGEDVDVGLHEDGVNGTNEAQNGHDDVDTDKMDVDG